MKKNIVYYVAHYSDMENPNVRQAAPAADLQVSYLSEIMRSSGYDVEIVSPCMINRRDKLFIMEKGYRKTIGNNVVDFMPSIGSRIKLLRGLGYFLTKLSLLMHLKNNVLKKRNGHILIYHSLYLSFLYRYFRCKHRDFILEVEEIYSDVIGDMSLRKKEINDISKAYSYIVPNREMHRLFPKGKKWMLYHGSCRREPKLERQFDDNKIHLVYAGTLDPRVAGNYVMVKIAEFLDDNYKIEILGVGTEDQKELMKNEIRSVLRTGTTCSVELHDCLYGEDYLSFLQSCDIGIYAQDPRSIDIYSSFPSKIMSYLSNGLRVVATKTTVLLDSEVSELLYYSERNDPWEFAETVKRINLEDEYDSRKELEKIEKSLRSNLKRFIG